MTLARRIAIALAAHAKRVMPHHRTDWANAMQNELPHIQPDAAALRWTLGALFAAYLERASTLCSAPAIRILLAFPIAFQAFGAIFAPSLILAYHLNNATVLGFFGGLTPGDDYHRFIPLLANSPAWYVALGFISGLLFLAAALQLLRHHRSAFPLFTLALAAELLGEALVRLIPGYAEAVHQVFTFTDPNFRRDVLIPAATNLLPFLLALALWLAHRNGRFSSSLSTQSTTFSPPESQL